MLKPYLKSGTPAICLITPEPDRGEKIIQCEDWSFFTWDCLRGIRKAGTHQTINEVTDPVEAINFLNGCKDCVLIMHNLHLFLDVPEVVQAIQNGVYYWKATGCALIAISPTIRLNQELHPFFTVVDLPLPDTEELHVIQKELVKPVNIKPNKAASRAAKGLTEFQAECSYALSIIQTGFVSTKVVTNSKAQMIRKSGLMEFWTPENIKNVGGLGNLKQFIESRKKAFDADSKMPKPKGILLVGIPGTGKSLSCKATASIMGWPLIRLDIGGLKNSLVGESERRIPDSIPADLDYDYYIKEAKNLNYSISKPLNTGMNITAAKLRADGFPMLASRNEDKKIPPGHTKARKYDNSTDYNIGTGLAARTGPDTKMICLDLDYIEKLPSKLKEITEKHPTKASWCDANGTTGEDVLAGNARGKLFYQVNGHVMPTAASPKILRGSGVEILYGASRPAQIVGYRSDVNAWYQLSDSPHHVIRMGGSINSLNCRQ